MSLERILGGFGKVLARFWEGLKSFGRIWGRSWKHFLKPFYVRTPALSREAPRSVPMRGGPRPPSVLNGTSPTSLPNLPWEGLRPLLRRLRVSRRLFGDSPLWRLLGHFFAFFSLFLRIVSQHHFFDRYFSMFYRFLEDFGWIWEGFWEVFCRFF